MLSNPKFPVLILFSGLLLLSISGPVLVIINKGKTIPLKAFNKQVETFANVFQELKVKDTPNVIDFWEKDGLSITTLQVVGTSTAKDFVNKIMTQKIKNAMPNNKNLVGVFDFDKASSGEKIVDRYSSSVFRIIALDTNDLPSLFANETQKLDIDYVLGVIDFALADIGYKYNLQAPIVCEIKDVSLTGDSVYAVKITFTNETCTLDNIKSDYDLGQALRCDIAFDKKSNTIYLGSINDVKEFDKTYFKEIGQNDPEKYFANLKKVDYYDKIMQKLPPFKEGVPTLYIDGAKDYKLGAYTLTTLPFGINNSATVKQIIPLANNMKTLMGGMGFVPILPFVDPKNGSTNDSYFVLCQSNSPIPTNLQLIKEEIETSKLLVTHYILNTFDLLKLPRCKIIEIDQLS